MYYSLSDKLKSKYLPCTTWSLRKIVRNNPILNVVLKHNVFILLFVFTTLKGLISLQSSINYLFKQLRVI